MDHISTELANDWVNYARASLASRIQETERSTEQVLLAVQAIAAQLNDKQELEGLLSLKVDQSTPSQIMLLLSEVLEHLDSHDALAQLIAPLFATLQFEDRIRQKMEGLLKVLADWADVCNDEAITDEELSSCLEQHIVTAEQKVILANYFPDHIHVDEDAESISLF